MARPVGASPTNTASGAPQPDVDSWRAVGEPVWSPTGDQLAVVVANEQQHDERVALLQRVGSELRRGGEIELRWGTRCVRFAERGQGLLFTIFTGDVEGVWTLDLATGLSRRLIPDGFQATSQPNGDVLFLRREDDGLNLYLWKRTTGQSVKLTKNALVRDWAVSPEGTSVAVLYTQRGTAEEIGPTQQVLAVVSLEKNLATTRIASAPHLDYGVGWSDNQRVVFIRTRRVSSTGSFESAVFESETRTGRETVRLPYGRVPPIPGRGWWSTDGRYAVYPATTPGPGGFLRISPQVFVRVDTRNGDVARLRFPFSVRAASLSPDAKLLVGVADAKRAQAAVGDWASGKVRPISVAPASGSPLPLEKQTEQ